MGNQLMNSTKTANTSSLKSARAGLLQRQCACGQHAIGGECKECHKKKGILQRSAIDPAPNLVPPLVHEVLRSPGQPLDATTRAFMEPRFGHDFSKVRVHADAKAAESSQAVNALAYTVASNVVFGAMQYAPKTKEGQRLMAHELTHVVQQGSAPSSAFAHVSLAYDTHEKDADAIAGQVLLGHPLAATTAKLNDHALQRQAVPGGGATPGTGVGLDLIFIIKAHNDPYTSDVTNYVKTVLQGQHYEEVDNLDQIFSRLDNLSRPQGIAPIVEGLKPPKGTKPYSPKQIVRRIRIVAHGSTTGGVKMKPAGEKKRRWFTPSEIKSYASKPNNQVTIKRVMTPGAVVEFWGCNIGNVPEAGRAWSSLFGSKFKATTETFKTEHGRYYRPAARGERGQTIPNQKGTWIRVTRTSDVDKRNRGLQDHFRQWLLQTYGELVQNGDILPIKDQAEQLQYMRDLFDRSDGDIIHIIVMKKSDRSLVRPGDQSSWAKLWVEFPPLNIGANP